MSAFVVEKGHIDALVLGGRQFGLFGSTTDQDDLDSLGLALWAENEASVGDCYEQEPEKALEYRFSDHGGVKMNPYALLKVIACFEYQSCELVGWETSKVRFYCLALRAAVLDTLPAGEKATVTEPGGYPQPKYSLNPAYEGAPWGIESPPQIAA